VTSKRQRFRNAEVCQSKRIFSETPLLSGEFLFHGGLGLPTWRDPDVQAQEKVVNP
jgi:hypothetical protein